MKAYKLICPVCFYTVHVLSKHGRFSPREAVFERCPACNRDVVPIVSKRDLPDSFDFNQFKKM